MSAFANNFSELFELAQVGLEALEVRVAALTAAQRKAGVVKANVEREHGCSMDHAPPHAMGLLLGASDDIIRAHDLAVAVVREYEAAWYRCRALPQWQQFRGRLRVARKAVAKVTFRRAHPGVAVPQH